MLNIHRIESFVTVLGLVRGAFASAPAHPAVLRFLITTFTPVAQPQVVVTVTGTLILVAEISVVK